MAATLRALKMYAGCGGAGGWDSGEPLLGSDVAVVCVLVTSSLSNRDEHAPPSLAIPRDASANGMCVKRRLAQTAGALGSPGARGVPGCVKASTPTAKPTE